MSGGPVEGETNGVGHGGQSIGAYRVVRELGRGGMGVVLEVRHPQVDRRLALKLILGDADAMALQRFGQEAQLMARVRHRSVVGIHELGRCPRGPFLVSDLVEGEGLDRRCKAGALEPREAAALAAELADALAALHAAKVLHRDLKPANVIVRPDGVPVILDLGIARDESAERLTQTGALMGTPAYMSPEQCEGVKDLDGRSDVYGLGAVLFECLTGAAPYDQHRHPMAIVKDVLTRDPTWPAAARRAVPAELQAIVITAMARERDARYPTAQALRDDLRAYLAGEQVWALGTSYYLRARRRRALTVAATSLLAVGLVAAVTAVAVGVVSRASRGGEVAPVAARDAVAIDPAAVELDLLRAEHEAAREHGLRFPDSACARWGRLRAWTRANPAHARRPEAERLALAERRRFGLSLPGPGPHAPPHKKRAHLLTKGLAIDGRRVLLLRQDGLVGAWDAVEGEALWAHELLGGPEAFSRKRMGTGPNAMAISPDRSQAVIVGGEELRRVDLATGAEVGAPIALPEHALSVTWDRTHIAVGGDLPPPRDSKSDWRAGWAALVDPATGALTRLVAPATGAPDEGIPPLPYLIDALAFTPDGRRLAAAGGGPYVGLETTNVVLVWDVASRALLGRNAVPGQGTIRAMAMGEDGASVLCGTASQSVARVSIVEPFARAEPPDPESEVFIGQGCTLRGESKRTSHQGALRGIVRTPGVIWSCGSSDWDEAPSAQVHRWTPEGLEDRAWREHPASTCGVRPARPKRPDALLDRPSDPDFGDPCTLDVSPDGRLLVIGMRGADAQVWLLD